jgi:hypothetical protein
LIHESPCRTLRRRGAPDILIQSRDPCI